MNETFGKPCAGAIIEKNENGVDYILIQERNKDSDIQENGLLNFEE
ncbi:MAG: hypothetical protein RR891_10020 [Clostridium sp.]